MKIKFFWHLNFSLFFLPQTNSFQLIGNICCWWCAQMKQNAWRILKINLFRFRFANILKRRPMVSVFSENKQNLLAIVEHNLFDKNTYTEVKRIGIGCWVRLPENSGNVASGMNLKPNSYEECIISVQVHMHIRRTGTGTQYTHTHIQKHTHTHVAQMYTQIKYITTASHNNHR